MSGVYATCVYVCNNGLLRFWNWSFFICTQTQTLHTRKSSPNACLSMCNDDNVIDKTTATQWEARKNHMRSAHKNAHLANSHPFCVRFFMLCFVLFRLLRYLTRVTAPIIIIIQFVIIIFRDFMFQLNTCYAAQQCMLQYLLSHQTKFQWHELKTSQL